MGPINWREMPDKDKIGLLITHALKWPVVESLASRSDAWPVAWYVTECQCWQVKYKQGNYFSIFDPLHSLDAAWQLVEKMKESNWHAFCIDLDGAITQHKWNWPTDDPYVTWFEKFVAGISAERVCIAALCTVGLEVTV